MQTFSNESQLSTEAIETIDPKSEEGQSERGLYIWLRRPEEIYDSLVFTPQQSK
jgi:hypothetical protein